MSMIMIAVTLTLLAQSYLDTNIVFERKIIDYSSFSTAHNLSEDIALDLQKLLDISVEKNNNEDTIEFKFETTFPANENMLTNFSDYNSFLYETFFTRIHGNQEFSYSNLIDGNAEINFQDYLFKIDYENDSMLFSPVLNKDLNSIDLNFYYSGDVNSTEWVSENIGLVPFSLKIIDSNSSTIENALLDSTEENIFKIVLDDSNLLIYVGLVESQEDSVFIDSNTVTKLITSLDVTFETTDFNCPGKFNAIVRHWDSLIDTNFYPKVTN